MNNRQRAAQETKKKLIEAGEKLIAEKGLHDISIEGNTNA